MKTRVRHLEILDLIQREQSVKVADLAKRFGTSEMTIRRDLGILAQQYSIVRTHGGATALHDSVVKSVTFDEARIPNRECKELIAKKAAELITDRQRIYVDAGSTTRQIVKYIPNKIRAVIVTNSITVAEEAMQSNNLSVIMLGGEVISAARCTSGLAAEEQLRNYTLDIAFVGAAALGNDGKMYDGYSPEARVKYGLFNVSKHVCLLIDSSKFNCYDLHPFGSLENVDTLVTDRFVVKSALEFLEQYRTHVILADSTIG